IDGGLGRRVLERVAEQVVDGLAQRALVEPGGGRTIALDPQLDLVHLGDRAQARAGFAYELTEVAVLAIEAEVTHRLEVEQRAGELAEAIDVVTDRAQRLAQLFVGAL